MNLSDIRTRVARASGMSPSDSGDLALIDAWANEAVIQFLKDTKLNVLMASLSLTAAQDTYTLDTNILAFTDVYFQPTSGYSHLLQPIDSAELLRMKTVASAAEVGVMYYALVGAHTLMLYPAPLRTGDKLHVLYVPRPSSTLSATADAPSDTARGNIPPEYHPVIESYVKWKACEAEEHKPSQFGQIHQAAYMQGAQKVKGDLNRKAGVLKAPAKWGRKSRRFPVTPGTDLG